MQGHRNIYTYYSYNYSQYADFAEVAADDVSLHLAYCDDFLIRGHFFS